MQAEGRGRETEGESRGERRGETRRDHSPPHPNPLICWVFHSSEKRMMGLEPTASCMATSQGLHACASSCSRNAWLTRIAPRRVRRGCTGSPLRAGRWLQGGAAISRGRAARSPCFATSTSHDSRMRSDEARGCGACYCPSQRPPSRPRSPPSQRSPHGPPSRRSGCDNATPVSRTSRRDSSAHAQVLQDHIAF